VSTEQQTQPRRWQFARPELNLDRIRDFGILFALLALFVALSVASDVFLTTRNLLNILDQWTPVCLMALGGTMVLIAGGFDLSVGAVFAVAGIVCIKVTNATSVEIGLLAGVLSGVGLGLINGFLVTVLRMNVFVATIGTSIVLSGFATVITEGTVQTTAKEGFDAIGTNEFLGVKLTIWIMFASIVVAAVVLNRTALGRHIRAVGGNIEAARLSGVRVQWVRASTFAMSGLGAGMAAVIVASRSLSANASGFEATQYNVWTALLLGGNSMVGGEGAIWRTVVGVALLALIGNGFTLLNIDPLYQQIATGGILLLAVAIDMQVRRRRQAT
jgi:ribose transport system permease protein